MPRSADFPYAPRYVEARDTHLHYIESGTGRPVVFLAGALTWSYVWRNVIPWVAPFARCLAFDHAGMGRSGKPKSEYRFHDQARYLEAALDALGLEDVLLVLSDMGAGLGLDWARRHEERVGAIAFVSPGRHATELLLEAAYSRELPEVLLDAYQRYRGEDSGWHLAGERNLMLTETLPRGVLKKLTPEELARYCEPYPEPEDRRPLWRMANDRPLDRQPLDMMEPIQRLHAWLRASDLPKLFVHTTGHTPLVGWCRENLSALETAQVGPASYLLTEDQPEEVGQTLARWVRARSHPRAVHELMARVPAGPEKERT